MTIGQWVLLVSLVLAVSFGLWRARTDGRFRPPKTPVVGDGPVVPVVEEGPVLPVVEEGPVLPVVGEGPVLPVVEEGAVLPVVEEGGARLETTTSSEAHVTLLQFSSAFCAPCRATRRVLEQVASETDGVVHREIDAEENLDMVRQFGVLRTPTTVILDADGVERSRATGAPTLAQVRAALASLSGA